LEDRFGAFEMASLWKPAWMHRIDDIMSEPTVLLKSSLDILTVQWLPSFTGQFLHVKLFLQGLLHC
jgi:hypothetical protein